MSPQPDIDQLIETALYLYTEGRRITKASGSRWFGSSSFCVQSLA